MEQKLNMRFGAEFVRKGMGLVRKYRYVMLVLLIGVVLLLWKPGDTEQAREQVQSEAPLQQEQTLEEKLQAVLSSVEGAGRVEVVLTYESSAETVYQTQPTRSESPDGAFSEKEETVILSQGSGTEAGLPQRTIYPRCRGALIVCDGAENPLVRLAIKEAVSCLTGLGTDRISVIKRRES